MSNIVRFPKANKNFQENNEQNQKSQIEMITEEMVGYIMYRFQLEGYAVDDPKVMKSQFLLEQSILSLLAHSRDIYYPVQDIATDLFDFENELNVEKEYNANA